MDSNHYIHEDYSLETFIENFYESKEDNDKLISIIKEKRSESLSEITTIVLLGEMKFKSVRKLGYKLYYSDPTKLSYTIDNDSISVSDGEYKFSLKKSDAKNTLVICKSGYKNDMIAFLLNQMIEFGFVVINSPDAVNIVNDKYLTAELLDKNEIPQPKYVLVSHSDIHKGDDSELEEKLKHIYKKIDDETKFVCKILNGHGGRGVFLCRKFNIMSVLQCLFAINEEVMILVQEYKEIEDGDIRVHVITLNGKQEIVSASMRKKSSSDFRTNLSLGNDMEDNITLTSEQKTLALKAAKVSGLVWAGVDILHCKDGSDVVLEINGAPGPPSPINGDKDELEKMNEKFYQKIIDTVNKLC